MLDQFVCVAMMVSVAIEVANLRQINVTMEYLITLANCISQKFVTADLYSDSANNFWSLRYFIYL